ncbi:MAG TPA: prolipoprotein diacylglyceryl transferase [bacterium]|uniref:Phosphatidylglycerol--prolipoprotein diacylglyceryl transferase n=1 Tax=candidate division TA06 bacterium ADurb.Bin417 TaxID=1852828 RepID=A0A1V5MD47_UNCT6|nr:MAG: Prolipoprotein diacylglyceryl transferase [candidate division TA06 bacterium ADurb.Bin417]HNQ35488.1 prolipoprotein diacylglyceryl transferase [bacterium]HNS48453.1 prolipoprotein diacylglyceryl transferase [bacterium]
MHPILLKLGAFPIYTYGVMAALGVGLSAWLGIRRAVRSGLSEDLVYNFVFITIISGLLGARLVHVAAEWVYYRNHLLEIFLIRRGGLAVQGALLAGMATANFYLARLRLPARTVLDHFFVYLPLGQAIGRLGCFFNGCCYGMDTRLPWGLHFPGLSETVHPTQLYYLLADLLLLAFLVRLGRNRTPGGTITAAYLVGFGLIRCLLDPLRGDLLPAFLGLYATQWYGILFILIGLVVYLTRSRESEPGSGEAE